MTDAQLWLLRSVLVQVLFSILLGWVMLIPRQPWGAKLKPLLSKDFTAAHTDWLMLAFMQAVALGVLRVAPIAHAPLVAVCLIVGGWLNPLPYALRAFGINAFSLSGSPVQKASALLGAGSAVAITIGWATLVFDALKA
ncbi:MAG: hypothetical protein JNK05_29150 [Myxococcales bacterium]|nr:hypothetical protein [Myxococcales bacterium]